MRHDPDPGAFLHRSRIGGRAAALRGVLERLVRNDPLSLTVSAAAGPLADPNLLPFYGPRGRMPGHARADIARPKSGDTGSRTEDSIWLS